MLVALVSTAIGQQYQVFQGDQLIGTGDTVEVTNDGGSTVSVEIRALDSGDVIVSFSLAPGQSRQEPITQGVSLQSAIKVNPFCAIDCLLSGVAVVTPHGLVPVEALQPGDTVLGAATRVEVARIRESSTLSVVEMRVGPDLIRTSRGHKFLTADRGWVEAQSLEVGDEISTRDGDSASIERVTVVQLDEPQPVFTIVLDGGASVLVGESNLVAEAEEAGAPAMAQVVRNE
ncbi:MAG: hypothetical protein AAF628_21535 [Planctomycetota bacterium]